VHTIVNAVKDDEFEANLMMLLLTRS